MGNSECRPRNTWIDRNGPSLSPSQRGAYIPMPDGGFYFAPGSSDGEEPPARLMRGARSWGQWSKTNKATMQQAFEKFVASARELYGEQLPPMDALQDIWHEMSIEGEMKQHYIKQSAEFQRAAKMNLKRLIEAHPSYLHRVSEFQNLLTQGTADLDLNPEVVVRMFDELSPVQKATYHPLLYERGRGAFETELVE